MRRLYFFGIFIICLASYVLGQEEHGCGTTVSEKEIDHINSILYQKRRIENGKLVDIDNTKRFIAITPHIVRKEDGTGGLGESQLLDAIEYLNETYEDMNMTFFIIGDINYINSDEYYDFDSSQEEQITGTHNVPNTINIYFYNSLSSGESSLCGYAYFPSTGRDHVMMANGCTVNRGSTLPHEIGHYFNLYHTHGKTNTGTTDELVDGSNCLVAGDDLCDTPADPNLSGKVDSDCAYTGSNRDANGQLYAPNPRNFMSYAPGQCRELFSSDQGARIVEAYETFKTYLIDKYYVADFSSKDRRICVGESVQFVDESIAANSILWEFPGGEPSTSSDKFPVVSYSSSGNYDVSLTIETDLGDTETKTLSNYVTVLGDEVGVESINGSFEEESLTEEVINDDLDITFEKTASTASEGSNSARINYINYSSIGAVDYLLAGKINTSVNKQIRINFDYAYARYDDEFFDGLAIVIKSSCGEWFEVWRKEGTELATAEDHTSTFIPLSDEWESVSLTIQIPMEFDNTEIAFKGINGFGNILYIDNYSINPTNESFSIDNLVVDDASCSNVEDGSILISTTGSSDLEYSIDGESYQDYDIFENLVPGDYVVYVREKGTSNDILAIATIGPKPITYTTNVVDPYCESDIDGSVEFLLEGGTGNLEVNFDNQGFSNEYKYYNLASGVYSFIIQDQNGCTQNGTVTISATNESPTEPVISVFSNILSFNVDPDITSIQWYRDGEPIAGATRSTLANPSSGEYTVEVFNQFCSSISDSFIVLDIHDIGSKLVIRPNPVQLVLGLKLPLDLQVSINEVQVLDLSGRVLMQDIFKDNIDVSGLKPGLYIVGIVTNDGFITKRFIKQ